MNRAQGVIGGMFGDEGKGLMTDALASRMMQTHGSCVVVRFNGGAQAGHTVQLGQGERHIFHHLGSGAFAGASTYLAKRFVAHPMLFLTEKTQISSMGGQTQVFIDPRCMITTPYDVMINQAIEQSRGTGRHGSCGIGFGETIERNEKSEFTLVASDLENIRKVQDLMLAVRDHYLPVRLEKLGLDAKILDQWRMNDGILARFLDDAVEFSKSVSLRHPDQVLSGGVVFEGAQGLGLDEDLGAFPYVTRSKTGLPYLLEVCDEAGLARLDVHYGTRAYTTRHGAGPMEHEDGTAPPGFEDATNQPNDFQGTLRFSPLHVDKLVSLVHGDMKRAQREDMNINIGGFVSCLDQMRDITPLAGGKLIATDQLPHYLQERLNTKWMHESRGPTRSDVKLSIFNIDQKAIERSFKLSARG